jgi:hypothetical protein
MTVTNSAASALTNAFKASKGLNSLEQQSLAGLSGDDLTRARAQLMLQKQQETVAFISNMMKKMNEIAMSVINNMR